MGVTFTQPDKQPFAERIAAQGKATIALTGGPACTTRVSGSVTVSGCR